MITKPVHRTGFVFSSEDGVSGGKGAKPPKTAEGGTRGSGTKSPIFSPSLWEGAGGGADFEKLF